MNTPEKIYIEVLNGEITPRWAPNREDQTDVEYIRADIHEAQIDALKAEMFTAGARALFDVITFVAANNWHGNPEMDKKCKEENSLIIKWATDALDEVSPESCSEWKEISVMAQRIRELEGKDRGNCK